MTNNTAPLVLVAPLDATPEDLERTVDNLTTITGGRVPVVVVPHGWTQAQIDETAIRAAVVAEREALCAIFEQWGREGEEYISSERIIAAIRARATPPPIAFPAPVKVAKMGDHRLSSLPEGATVRASATGREIKIGDVVTEADGDLVVTYEGQPGTVGFTVS